MRPLLQHGKHDDFLFKKRLWETRIGGDPSGAISRSYRFNYPWRPHGRPVRQFHV